MPTKVTSNLLSAGAALGNLNDGADIVFTKPVYATDNLSVSGNFAAAGYVTGLNIVYNPATQANSVPGSLTVNGALKAPNQALSATDSTVVLTQKAASRDDMWSCFQKKLLFASTGAQVGTSFTSSTATTQVTVVCGTAAIGRAVCVFEAGMTQNPGTGTFWTIPSSFSVAFGFWALHVNSVLTSSNISSGSTTFTVNATTQVQAGMRIWSSAFPENTYVSTIVGTTITATKAATSTPAAPHTVVFSPDQIGRVVLGTTNSVSRFTNECPNAGDVLTTGGAVSSGANNLTVIANINSSTVVTFASQPYVIITTSNSSITAANATTWYFACTNFAAYAVISVLRVDAASGTAAAKTGASWNGSVIPTNTITVDTTGLTVGQTVSHELLPHNAVISSVGSGVITISVSVSTVGSGATIFIGYQRVYLDANGTGTVSQGALSCGFMLKTWLNSYIYGHGIPLGTKISAIQNWTANRFYLLLDNTFTRDAPNGVSVSTVVPTSSSNNCIFMDFGADPADGYLKVRLGYMLNGLISYSAWASFPAGNVPHASYSYYYQAVIDYNATADVLRLFANRNAIITEAPAISTTPLATMSGVSALSGKLTNLSFGAQISGNNLNTLANATVARLDIRNMTYYPFQTFID